jgi:hypothetical protein
MFALCVAATLAVTAQTPPASQLQPVPAPAPATALPVVAAKEHIPEGTEVPLLFVDAPCSTTNGEGDRFTLRVDGDVKIGGVVAIKSGSIAVGTATNAHGRGFTGKAGERNVFLDHVNVADGRVKLRASNGKTGDAKVGATVALTILYGPIGYPSRCITPALSSRPQALQGLNSGNSRPRARTDGSPVRSNA